jgi:hypothetical protein
MRLITASRRRATSSSSDFTSSLFTGGVGMTTVDLGALQLENALYIARSRAIDAYSRIEQSLSMLLSYLLGTSMDLAAIVFFRITNANSRNAIIEDLLAKRHGETYKAYWDGIPGTHNKRGLFTWLRQLDADRNKIVHWAVVNNVAIEGETAKSTLSLRKPNFGPMDHRSKSV